MRKDKQKVIGEPISDEQIKSYLNLNPQDNTNADFYRLIKAYRGLRANDFAKFIEFFVKNGGNLQAFDQNGQTFSKLLKNHKNSALYLQTIETYLN